MKINRSSVLTLNRLTLSKKDSIKFILTEYSNVVNWFIENFEDEVISGKNKYYFLSKEKLNQCSSWFSNRLKQDAYSEAYSMLQSAISNSKNKNGEYYRPIHYGKKCILSSKIVKIENSKNIKDFDLIFTLTSIGNKLKLILPVKKHRQFNKWDELGKLSSTITLFENKIQVSFEIKIGKKKQNGYYLGIDTGMNQLLACSDKNVYGNTIRELLLKLKNKKRCSKAYYRCKKEIKDYINNELKKLDWQNLQLIVVENLKNIKYKTKVKRRLTKNIRRLISDWNYRFVLNRIQMLCEENRVSFRSVSPFWTSQTCSKCGHRDQRNRLTQECFCCQKCGYSDNADYNASLNILNRFLTGKYGSGFQV